ncbi:hypothetical protein Barb4_02119 [Bacteroidales bacterium Barb4]|nr:hypothetical protein Barb4_02119 [Bacteroidales bacterium Barb4]
MTGFVPRNPTVADPATLRLPTSQLYSCRPCNRGIADPATVEVTQIKDHDKQEYT